jgi:hypothetical protein
LFWVIGKTIIGKTMRNEGEAQMDGSLARRVASIVAALAMLGAVFGCWPPAPPDEDITAFDASELDCAPEIFDSMGPLDVAIAIDTSLSTVDPSGRDVDGDGVVGAIVESRYTDPDDSILSAIVASVRTLLENAADHDIHFSLITFSGRMNPSSAEPPKRVILRRDAVIRTALTDDTQALIASLDAVLERGSKGMSNYFAGMRLATRSLVETKDIERESRKRVLFISDSPTPLSRRAGDVGVFTPRDVRLESSAREAIGHRVIFNTFGVAEDSKKWRKFTLGRIAGATGGTYHAVEDSTALYCHLASSLTIRSKVTPEEMEELLRDNSSIDP